MQAVLNYFTLDKGWSQPLPALDSPQTLVIVFCHPEFKHYQTALEDIHRYYAQSIIVGCSSSASIFYGRIIEEGLVIGIVRFHKTRLQASSARLPSPYDSWQAGKQLAKQLHQPDLKGVLLLSDGLYTNGVELLRGLTDHLLHSVPIVGGLASDGGRFQETWVLHQGKPTAQIVYAIGFYGHDILIKGYAADGWKLFGLQRKVTRSTQNTLYEIDHRPALQIYKHYVGDQCKHSRDFSIYFPMAVWPQDNTHYVVRTIFNVDEETQSMNFASDIPEGSKIQFMYGNTDSLVEGAETAIQTILHQLKTPDQPLLSLAFSCVGRKLMMEDETDQELTVMLDCLPKDSWQLGFYSYGELGPIADQAQYSLHNETMTLMVIYEKN